jgi:hypothetical protein
MINKKKKVSYKKKEIINLTKQSLQKYFIELEPLYFQDGAKVKQARTFQAKSLTPFEEQTNYSPIVEIARNKYITIDKMREAID